MITTWRAMGTSFEIHTATECAVEAAVERVEAAEARFSRFRPDSELSQINRAGVDGHRVSRDMANVLEIADDLTRRTSGLVDPGVGGAVIDWGYMTSFAHRMPLASLPIRTGTRSWQFDGETVTLGASTRLDLGGVVKGWICDRLVEDGVATVASAGGDLRSVDPDLFVQVLDGDDETCSEVHVGVGAFATSSRARRRWTVGSMEAHHLIDPRTMAPAITPVVSGSAGARTAVEAEAGAKMVLLRGADGLAWADRQSWIDFALAIWHDGSVYATTLTRAS